MPHSAVVASSANARTAAASAEIPNAAVTAAAAPDQKHAIAATPQVVAAIP